MNGSSTTFTQFLTTLAAELDNLFAPADAARLKVNYATTLERAGLNDILLGVSAGAGRGHAATHEGVVLQSQSPQRALSEYVQRAPISQFQDWRRRLGAPASLRELRATLYTKDASPDSCLSFICFLARLFGVTSDALPVAWCAYASRWEGGDMRTTGTPFASWGCLHSALSHSYLAPPTDSAQADPHGVEIGFTSGVRYLLCLLTQTRAPERLPKVLNCPEHVRARAHLWQEYKAYHQALASAERVQLRLPMRAAQRSLLVDAYLGTESDALDSKKVFLRTDAAHTWLKQGFTLLAFYRPAAAGAFEISVDAATGVHLQALWQALEHLEDERWTGQRPRAAPCPLASYPDGTGPDQPWWDDNGNYTVVTSPQSPDARPATRLSWEDVRETLWALYNPARELRFIPGNANQAAPLHACPPVQTAVKTRKRLLVARWDAHNGELLPLSPTAKRYLAACAAASHPQGPALAVLPDASSFDFYPLPGGFAVIHADGVLLLDDWSSTPLPLQACQAEFEHVAQRLNIAQEQGDAVTQQAQHMQSALGGGRAWRQRATVAALARCRLALRNGLTATGPASQDERVLGFRQRLETRWAVATTTAEVDTTIEQLLALAQTQLETRVDRLLQILTIYGFPAVLLAALFGIFGYGPATGEAGLHLHWPGLLLYLLLTGTAVGAVRFWLKRLNGQPSDAERIIKN